MLYNASFDILPDPALVSADEEDHIRYHTYGSQRGLELIFQYIPPPPKHLETAANNAKLILQENNFTTFTIYPANDNDMLKEITNYNISSTRLAR